MTVKQAYEIFYGPTSEEITEEFIRTTITESSLKEAKAKVSKRYNQNVIKLRKEADPNNKILNLISTGDNREQIISEINKAYEILRKCITIYNYEHDEEEEILLFTKYDKYLVEQKEEKTTKEKSAMERAFNIYFYHIQEEMKKNADEAKDTITWEVDLVKVFEEIYKYKKREEKLSELRKNKQAQLRKYLNMQRNTEFRNQDIKFVQQTLAEEYYKEVQDEELYEKMALWLKENIMYFKEQYHKDKKEILNFVAKANQRLKNAKELYILIVKNKCIEYIESNMLKINDPKMSDIEKLKIANSCQEMISKTEKLIDKCERKYLVILEKIQEYKEKPITERTAKELELMVKELITDEFIELLSQQTLAENSKLFHEKLPIYQQNCAKIKKVESKGRNQLKVQISKNIKYLKQIDVNFETLSMVKINNLSNEELIKYHQEIKVKTKKALKRAIKKHYEFILIDCKYRMAQLEKGVKENRITDEQQYEYSELYIIETEYYDMYIEAMNSDNFSYLEEAYVKFHQLATSANIDPYELEEEEHSVRKEMIWEIIETIKFRFKTKGVDGEEQVEIFKGIAPITIKKLEIPTNITERFKTLRENSLDVVNTIELFNEIKELSTIEIYELLSELLTYVYNDGFTPFQLADSSESKKLKKR